MRLRARVPWAGVLLALMPSFAAAEHLDLSWNQCPQSRHTYDLALPCATPGGSAKLVGTIFSEVDIPGVVAMEITLDVFVDAPMLSDFWSFNTVISRTGCQRGVSLSVERPLSGCEGVADLWSPVEQGLEAVGVMGYYPTFGGLPNRGRLDVLVFRDLGHPTIVRAQTATFAFQIDLSTSLAIENGGPCAGCADPAAVRFEYAALYSANGDKSWFIFPGLWGNCVSANGGLQCHTPIQNRTWGALKALYR